MEDSFLGERKKALGNRVVSVASSLSIPFQYVNGIWVILVKNLHKRKVTQQHTYATHIDKHGKTKGMDKVHIWSTNKQYKLYSVIIYSCDTKHNF